MLKWDSVEEILDRPWREVKKNITPCVVPLLFDQTNLAMRPRGVGMTNPMQDAINSRMRHV
jgi:hypothetical protein